MSGLLTLGLSHRTADIAVRERVALASDRAPALVQSLLGAGTISEAVALSTCNRMELYLAVDDDASGETVALGALAAESRIACTDLVDYCYSLRGSGATRHLFAVTAGLDSMVLGESEIQGQVRRAYEDALQAGTTGPLTNRLFTAALAAGKRVRTETAIDRRGVTVGAAAVELAGSVLGDLGRRRMLVIGSGKSGELTAQALAGSGVRAVFVGGRRRDDALGAGSRFGVAVDEQDLPAELVRADIVLVSAAPPDGVFSRAAVEAVLARRLGRPIVVIDIGVPRGVEPQVGAIAGVRLFDFDDVQRRIERNASQRRAELGPAEAVIAAELARFEQWLAAIRTLPTVRDLRRRGEDVVAEVLADNEGRWEALTVADRERITLLARTIMSRLLHEPTRRLKDRTIDPALARELFGL
jgi:glutamyl-tRNA reductase